MNPAPCDACGAPTKPGAAFCSSCGTSVPGQRWAVSEEKAPGRADADVVGRSCPYCRFPLKPGQSISTCRECRAVHHLECFVENGGCAINGCAGQAAVPPRAPEPSPSAIAPTVAAPLASEFAAQPNLPPPSSRPFPWKPLLLVLGVVIALAGAGVAVAVTIGGGADRTRIITREGRTVVAAPASTVTVTNDAQPSQASAATSDQQPPSADRSYAGESYTLGIPRGWVRDSSEVDHGSYVESRWHLPGTPSVVLLIDHTAGYSGTAEGGAASVRSQFTKTSDYHEIDWSPTTLPAGDGWQWEFRLGDERKVDTFVVACGTGYAVLGAAPTGSFQDYRPVFARATTSLRPNC